MRRLRSLNNPNTNRNPNPYLTLTLYPKPKPNPNPTPEVTLQVECGPSYQQPSRRERGPGGPACAPYSRHPTVALALTLNPFLAVALAP